MIVEKIVVMSEGLTLSTIVWRRFRRPMPGLVEQTFDINPGLADKPHELPLGCEFLLPIPVPREKTILEPITLW